MHFVVKPCIPLPQAYKRDVNRSGMLVGLVGLTLGWCAKRHALKPHWAYMCMPMMRVLV